MREKEAHTTVLFVRHGVPDYPADRIYAREDDPGLTPEGMVQAEALGEWVRGKRAENEAEQRIDAVYVSPTRRTLETVAPMAKALGMEATVDDRLQERHFGVWEGMDFDAIRDQYPEEFLAWKTNPVGFAPAEGETFVDMESRVDEAVADICSRHAGGTALVVAHVGTIRTALCSALKTPLAEYRRFHIATGSVVRIDYGRHQANLIYLGILPGGRNHWTGGEA